jgi:hypothetical protein
MPYRRLNAAVLLGFAFLLTAGRLIAVQEAEAFKSGPQVGELLPGPFDAFNINGKKAKGRQHCLVCEYGLNPAVMIFAREPEGGKVEPLASLLGKLDEAIARHAEEYKLGAAVVFLSPDARDSSNNAGEQDPKKIVDEAIARDALVKRLQQRADKLKSVVVAYYPAEGPKDYKINAAAEVTVLFYVKHKVLANFAFAPDKMTAADVAKIMSTVEESLSKKKK